MDRAENIDHIYKQENKIIEQDWLASGHKFKWY